MNWCGTGTVAIAAFAAAGIICFAAGACAGEDSNELGPHISCVPTHSDLPGVARAVAVPIACAVINQKKSVTVMCVLVTAYGCNVS